MSGTFWGPIYRFTFDYAYGIAACIYKLHAAALGLFEPKFLSEVLGLTINFTGGSIASL